MILLLPQMTEKKTICRNCQRSGKKIVRGFCPACYRRLRKGIPLDLPIKKHDKGVVNLCQKCGTKKVKVRGYCQKCAYHFDAEYRDAFISRRKEYRDRAKEMGRKVK